MTSRIAWDPRLTRQAVLRWYLVRRNLLDSTDLNRFILGVFFRQEQLFERVKCLDGLSCVGKANYLGLALVTSIVTTISLPYESTVCKSIRLLGIRSPTPARKGYSGFEPFLIF